MKKFFCLIFLLYSSICYAQFSKMTIYAGGLGTYTYQKNSELTGSSKDITQSLSMGPSIGLFPVEKLLVGGRLSWLSSKEEGANNNNSMHTDYTFKSKSFNAGPFVRYYFIKGLYAEASYFWGNVYDKIDIHWYDNVSSTSSESRTDQNLNGYSAGIGYSVFFNSNRIVALDLGILYRSYSKESTSYQGFSVGFGVSAFLFKTKE